MKRKYVFGAVLLLFISVICVAFCITDNDEFAIARREVLLRRIGHELLLQSGDSTSRVLPVKKTGKNEYRISFEKEFTFKPGSLVSTTRRLLAKDVLSADYVVNVLNSGTSGVVYGYAISKSKKDDIITCIGRKQPKASYLINIKFKPKGVITEKSAYVLGSLPFLAFVGFIFLRYVEPLRVLPDRKNADMLSFGGVLFDANNKKLMINGVTIELTGTESRLLLIFALSPNQIIERGRLQKEIWEDEGVIVGRSLDMFISKLRKKLEPDPTIKIAVIRGKGYKLEINA
ncbi:winged helix-turn-helix domain-containing protein [Mucilaginibacter segetis]|uniref:winged helix-turn-helix domain-containing protein n=1 Tax=Mucilaginibacter segetis TaxID=2793071 RepID=UPI00293D925B|nr:winged helix-turn-helix domain-containing protein [Mucilaginibacter segetis]